MLHTGFRLKMNDINILKEDMLQLLMKYQLCSFSQKLISPTDPSQFMLTYTVLLTPEMDHMAEICQNY